MKFSIRDLFLVTVIVALVVGWWVGRLRLNGLNSQLTRDLDDCRHNLEFTEAREDALVKIVWDLKRLPNSSAPAPNSPKD